MPHIPGHVPMSWTQQSPSFQQVAEGGFPMELAGGDIGMGTEIPRIAELRRLMRLGLSYSDALEVAMARSLMEQGMSAIEAREVASRGRLPERSDIYPEGPYTRFVRGSGDPEAPGQFTTREPLPTTVPMLPPGDRPVVATDPQGVPWGGPRTRQEVLSHPAQHVYTGPSNLPSAFLDAATQQWETSPEMALQRMEEELLGRHGSGYIPQSIEEVPQIPRTTVPVGGAQLTSEGYEEFLGGLDEEYKRAPPGARVEADPAAEANRIQGEIDQIWADYSEGIIESPEVLRAMLLERGVRPEEIDAGLAEIEDQVDAPDTISEFADPKTTTAAITQQLGADPQQVVSEPLIEEDFFQKDIEEADAAGLLYGTDPLTAREAAFRQLAPQYQFERYLREMTGGVPLSSAARRGLEGPRANLETWIPFMAAGQYGGEGQISEEEAPTIYDVLQQRGGRGYTGQEVADFMREITAAQRAEGAAFGAGPPLSRRQTSILDYLGGASAPSEFELAASAMGGAGLPYYLRPTSTAGLSSLMAAKAATTPEVPFLQYLQQQKFF